MNARGFGSDNHATVHPAVFEAMSQVNQGYAPAYGMDAHSHRLKAVVKDIFGEEAEYYLVFNGTAANVTALGALLKRHQSVLCSDVAHLHVDECAAPEAIMGNKLVAMPSIDGKVTAATIQKHLIRGGDQHFAQPGALSITQSTELGTVYTAEELSALSACAHESRLYVHMDGARLCNAAASLGTSLRALCTDVGIDALSFGGAKNGLLLGELVIFLKADLAPHFRFVRKQSMQLASKTRYFAAQFLAYFNEMLCLDLASHANAMASRLAEALRALGSASVRVSRETQSNAVFVHFPKSWIKALKEHSFFYVWDEESYECRLMCSWDTRPEDIDAFVDIVAKRVAERGEQDLV